MNKESTFISAVLYIRNNELSVGKFIEGLYAVLSNNFINIEIICVNDCSEDLSSEKIKLESAKIGEAVIVLISNSFYQGLESSMISGVNFASGDFVFEFDNISCDYDTSLIMDVYNRSVNGFDIVGASPNTKKRRSSRIFYSLYNKYSKSQYKIQTERFRILSRRAINRVNQISLTIPYRKAIYANCGLKYDCIPYDVIPTKIASYNVETSYRKDLAFDSFIIFTDIAYKASLLLTFIMMLFVAFVSTYTLFVYLNGNPVEGWTTLMFLVSIGFLGVFGILSIVIKYLSVIIKLIFKKTKHMISSIEKL